MVENLDDSDQFNLGRDFVRIFDVAAHLIIGLIGIRKPDRKFVKRPVYTIKTEKKVTPIF